MLVWMMYYYTLLLFYHHYESLFSIFKQNNVSHVPSTVFREAKHPLRRASRLRCPGPRGPRGPHLRWHWNDPVFRISPRLVVLCINADFGDCVSVSWKDGGPRNAQLERRGHHAREGEARVALVRVAAGARRLQLPELLEPLFQNVRPERKIPFFQPTCRTFLRAYWAENGSEYLKMSWNVLNVSKNYT